MPKDFEVVRVPSKEQVYGISSVLSFVRGKIKHREKNLFKQKTKQEEREKKEKTRKLHSEYIQRYTAKTNRNKIHSQHIPG